MPAQTTIDQYNALAGTLISRGKTPAGASLGAGAQQVFDASVGASDFITVEGSAGPGATAAGDLSVQVFPYMADGVTISGTPLPAVAATGYAGTLSGGYSQLLQKYDVAGVDMVRVIFKNNNAGALPVVCSWREESW